MKTLDENFVSDVIKSLEAAKEDYEISQWADELGPQHEQVQGVVAELEEAADSISQVIRHLKQLHGLD